MIEGACHAAANWLADMIADLVTSLHFGKADLPRKTKTVRNKGLAKRGRKR